MQKIWKVKPRTNSNLIRQLLENKGLAAETDLSQFLRPEYSQLNSPFLFAEMQKAVDRIWQAVINKEKVLIYSDYDADAVTSNAVLFRMFQALGIRAEVYIPDRFSEGYGLNIEAFEKIAEAGAQLVITVDCGTNSVDEADFCKANGIDLIITDHHELTGEVPDAFAVINPKRPGEKYPYRELTGVGVAFKLAAGVLLQKEKYVYRVAEAAQLPAGYEKWFLDLVAIGTVADCHSLMGENRTLVKYGLQVLGKTKWIGLRAMMQLCGLADKMPGAVDAKGALDTYSLGFIIAPRINAAGRIEHASVAFDLLVTDDGVEALRLAKDLENLNKRRQMLTENVMSEARIQLAELEEKRHKILLAVGNDWPKGVVGLVAGKLCEEYSKPVLVLERGEFEATGSARSIPSFNIVHALNYSKASLIKYGGHAAAAGFTLKNEHIDLFYRSLLDFAEMNINENDLAKVIEIEAEVQATELNLEAAETIGAFEPFGVDNRRPIFAMRGLKLVNCNAVGKEQKHLQLTVAATETVRVSNGAGAAGAGASREALFKCIAFNFGKSIQQLVEGDLLDIAFELIADSWNGRKTLKLRVVDFKKVLGSGSPGLSGSRESGVAYV